MSNVYLKGPGDEEEVCNVDFTDEQLIRAVKEHAVAVAYNATDEYLAMVRTALVEYFIYSTTDGLDELASASAEDLLHRGEI